MTSFDFDIPERELAGADHIAKVGRQIIAAFIRKCRDEKITKVELAKRMEVDKASITRMLRGDANLTLRSVGELCWALDVKPVFQVVADDRHLGRNAVPHVDVLSNAGASIKARSAMEFIAQ